MMVPAAYLNPSNTQSFGIPLKYIDGIDARLCGLPSNPPSPIHL